MNTTLKRLLAACMSLSKAPITVSANALPKMRRKPSLFNIDKPIFSIEGDEHWYSRPTVAMRCWCSQYGHVDPKITEGLMEQHCKRKGSTCDCIDEVAGGNLCSISKKSK